MTVTVSARQTFPGVFEIMVNGARVSLVRSDLDEAALVAYYSLSGVAARMKNRTADDTDLEIANAI